MIIVPVDNGDFDGRVSERVGCGHSAEARTHDDDTVNIDVPDGGLRVIVRLNHREWFPLLVIRGRIRETNRATVQLKEDHICRRVRHS